jgi:putative sigma-54 modulation protein
LRHTSVGKELGRRQNLDLSGWYFNRWAAHVQQNSGIFGFCLPINGSLTRREALARIEAAPLDGYNCEHDVGAADRAAHSISTLHESVVVVQIKISARHGHLTEATQQFIQEKAQKLLHIFERLTMIEVTVDQQRELKGVEFRVQAEHKHDFVARGEADDLLGAIDIVLHKLEMQLRRYKEKIQDHRRDPSTSQFAGGDAASEESGEE